MSGARSRPLWAIDCETDPFLHERDPEAFAWGATDGDTFLYWWGPDATAHFAAWLAAEPRLAVAHNGGRFDFRYLVPWIDRSAPLTLIRNRIATCTVGAAELRDSFLLYPGPLSDFRKDVIDYGKLERARRDQNRAEILRYLETDCRALWELVTAFYAENPGRPLTLPMAAMRAFREIEKTATPKSNEKFDGFFRPWYYGGRVEAIRRGIFARPFEVADIVSAYPRAMLEAHPWGTETEYLPRALPARGPYFARIRARSEGALPLRLDSGALHFPRDGESRLWWATSWEIEAGLDTRTLRIEGIEASWRFRRSQRFERYVSHYFERKRTEPKGSPQRLIAKIMLNGLYGKLAQDPRDHVEWSWAPRDAELPEGVIEAIPMGAWFLVARPKPFAQLRFFNVATAASITSYVRAQLWRAICDAREPLYCDTDSLAAVRLGDLDYGSEVGQWEHEGRFVSAAIGGKKLYTFQRKDGSYKSASKGVQLTPEQIRRVAQGDVVEWANPAPSWSLGSEVRFVKRRVRRT